MVRLPIVRRVYASLCVLLALMFAATSLSGAIDGFQHVGSAPLAHEHFFLSNLTVELDHPDDQHALESDDRGLPDHLPGTHHHHSDGGAGLLAAAAVSDLDAHPVREQHGFSLTSGGSSVNARGPERPPRLKTMHG